MAAPETRSTITRQIALWSAAAPLVAGAVWLAVDQGAGDVLAGAYAAELAVTAVLVHRSRRAARAELAAAELAETDDVDQAPEIPAAVPPAVPGSVTIRGDWSEGTTSRGAA